MIAMQSNFSFKVAEIKLNVEDDVSTSYFPPSKMSKCVSTIDYDMIQCRSSIHLLPAQQTVLCLSIGNTFLLTHYAADLDKIKINYHGPKVIP